MMLHVQQRMCSLLTKVGGGTFVQYFASFEKNDGRWYKINGLFKCFIPSCADQVLCYNYGPLYLYHEMYILHDQILTGFVGAWHHEQSTSDLE